MLDLPPLAIAAMTGFISGLLLAIPVGPVNLTIMNEGARRGFFWALLISLGASVMETIYCALAFTGFASLFQHRVVKASMEVFSFVFLLFLGIKFLLAKNVASPMHISKAADKIEERIEEKLHPHSAFMTGFVRVMANPGVLLFWIILATNFMSREWVESNLNSRMACVGGAALGTTLWFFMLSYGVSRGYGRFSERTLLKMEHFSGFTLLTLGLIHGGHIAWQLARHKM